MKGRCNKYVVEKLVHVTSTYVVEKLVQAIIWLLFWPPVICLLVLLVPLVQDVVLAALVPVVDAHLQGILNTF